MCLNQLQLRIEHALSYRCACVCMCVHMCVWLCECVRVWCVSTFSNVHTQTKHCTNIYIYLVQEVIDFLYLMCIVCENPSFPFNGAATLSNMSVAASHTIDSCMCPSHPLNGRVTSCTGSTVTYTCNSGYANHGSSQQRCQSGRYGYRWSSPAPSCVKLISKWVHNTEYDIAPSH